METLSIERSGITKPNPRVITFDARYRSDFARLNYAWIEKHFSVEPLDRLILDHPEEEIIAHGGQIFFALEGAAVVGTVALKAEDNATFELTKMAVDESHRGAGYGKLLLNAALAYARDKRAKRVVLSSHTSLIPAIKMYRDAGFIERADNASCYSRCNIYMQKDL
jgi:putative acetyltransferase